MDTSQTGTALIPTALASDPSQAIPLGYYECFQATDYIQLGELVRVTRVDGSTVHYQRRNRGFRQDSASFLAAFAYAPDGEAQYQQQILKVMGEISQLGTEVAELQQTLTQINVHVGQDGEAAGMEPITALATIDDRSPAGMKRTLASIRTLVHEKQELLKTKQAELRALMDEQMSIVNALLDPLKEMVARIQEGIWTVDLYLGRNEDIMMLQDGDPAPPNTPIVLRQLVLAMDEECAVAAETGGIDAMDIEAFDRWIVADSAHIEQVIPELKGVVVLVPRWTPKTYTDPWLSSVIAEENRQSYFLIRNGDRLYRVAPSDFSVGRHLVPTQNEFLDFFFGDHYNPTSRHHERVPLTPGSDAYMKALKQANARSRHYMRIALILQGLIDRTTVFHPLPALGLRLTTAEAYEQGWVTIINDAELLLGDGHERFREWQKRLNESLDVGMRIIGSFTGWSGDSSTFHGLGESRVSPSGANAPDSNTLYRLEGRREGGFYFRYDRTDVVYDRRRGLRQPDRRASCVVQPSDRFILAFDLATVEEMRYFLRSRQDRHEYKHLFPVLKAAIRMKQREEEEEEPFRLLLVGQIAATYGVDYETAAEEVPSLITWFKFKNKYHRALLSEDAKALRMIVAEFAVRLRERKNRAKRRDRGEFARIVEHYRTSYPTTLLIAHKEANQYVVLVPENDEPVFVKEITCTPERVLETKAWRIVDNRHQRWHSLYTSERWPTWQINASRSEHLTDPEIAAGGATAKQCSHEAAQRRASRNASQAQDGYAFMAVTFDRDDGEFHVYYLAKPATVPTDLLLSSTLQDVLVERDVYAWSRNVQRDVVLERRTSRETITWSTNGVPWDAGKYRRNGPFSLSMRSRAEVIIEVDATIVERTHISHAVYEHARAEQNRLQDIVYDAARSLREQWDARMLKQLYAEFMREYADESLWEGHLKSIRVPQYPYHDNVVIKAVLRHLVERGIDVHGLTFGQAVERYHLDGAEERAQLPSGGRSRSDRMMPADLDELVITMPSS